MSSVPLNNTSLAGRLRDCRAEIPALRNKHYFNFGGQGTMPQGALDAIMAAYTSVQERGPFSTDIFHWIVDELNSTRSLIATEFGGNPSSYVITQSVSEGCNITLWGLDWQPGEILLITDCEHPSLIAAAETLCRRRNITLQYVEISGLDDDEVLAKVKASLQKKTRMFAFSQVLWNTGASLPLKQMIEICHENSTQVLVDGAQALGAIPVDMIDSDVDYYAFTGHKWLCGPEGVGSLYIKKELLAKLEPTFVGWRSHEMLSSADALGSSEAEASRFEVATSAFPLLAGLRAAIKFHQQFGTTAQRYEKLIANTNLLRESLVSTGKFECIIAKNGGAGLVSFKTKRGTPSHAVLVAACEQQRFFMRTIPFPDCIRASVHYFTSTEEIESLVKTLSELS